MSRSVGAMDRMTEEQLTDEVLGRLEATPDLRLREVMHALVRHLHAFAREVRLTDEEWLQGVRFLTATGDITDAVRQEFILLSDTLGLSSLVDLINHADVESLATEPTILGPFYVPESPWREFGASMVEYDDGGEAAILRGVVRDDDGAPIPGAVLDVWQNAATGFYAVQQPDEQPATNLRGRYRADDEGRFEIRTVRPVPYPIPDDGPVGRLLQATGRHQWRAAHIHLKATADGFTPLTTHIFDRASDYLDSDTVFGVKDSLIEEFVPGPDGVLVCEHDVVLTRGWRRVG
ncbi:MAG: hydroxyquinol 1,2-dioxygenase [Nocardioidaceae bacterium]|nr:hydroxyquinol 1,2-dioxygenase [Nocardioidaceae bacterium]